MNLELENIFYARWSKWFKSRPLKSYSGFWGFEHGDGWFDLVRDLCEKIEPLAAKIPDFTVLQVKEKFGGLRFYVSHGNEEIHTVIQSAEQESFKTCETCGQSGTLRTDGWLKTLCDRCYTEWRKR